RQLAQGPPEAMVRAVTLAGYTGLTIDRWGYQDRGAELETRLKSLLGQSPFVSANGRHAYFDLTAYVPRLRKEYGEGKWAAERGRVLHPVLVGWRGFHDMEGNQQWNCRWSFARCGALELHNTATSDRVVSIDLVFMTREGQATQMQIGGDVLRESVRV